MTDVAVRATFTTMGRAAIDRTDYVYRGVLRDVPPVAVPPPAPRPAPRPRAPLKECGTNAGYKRHKRAGQAACEACLAAHSEANKAQRRRPR